MGRKYLNFLLIVTCAISIILAWSSFRHSKNIQLDFNEKKSTLIKENLDLKDRINSLDSLLKEKTEQVTALEEGKNSLENELIKVKAENEKINANYAALSTEKQNITEQLDLLKKNNLALKNKVEELENNPLVKKLRDSIEKEQNAEIKKVLESALSNIELLRSGKSISLNPIVVNKELQSVISENLSLSGKIISIDSKNNLAVISLGKKDNLNMNDLCVILNDKGESVAYAEVIGVRYQVAAIFINKIKSNFTLSDIKEGYKVIIAKQ